VRSDSVWVQRGIWKHLQCYLSHVADSRAIPGLGILGGRQFQRHVGNYLQGRSLAIWVMVLLKE
jgi:hypothetical protein